MKNTRAALLQSIVALLLSSAMGPTSAATGAWEVGKVSGPAWIQSEQTARIDLRPGMSVAEGMTVFTSDHARVMLVRGSESMMVGPRSVMAIGPGREPGLDTTILQQVGAVTFEVERLDHPHFSVETPMLAAVVKGTHFTVSVTRRTANVSVARGLVGVTSLSSGETADVSPGQRATAVAGPRGGLSVGGVHGAPPVVPGLPRTPVVPTVAAAALATTVAATAASPQDSSYAATTSDAPSTAPSTSRTSTRGSNNPGNPAMGSVGAATTRSASTSAGQVTGAAADGNPSTAGADAGNASAASSGTSSGPSSAGSMSNAGGSASPGGLATGPAANSAATSTPGVSNAAASNATTSTGSSGASASKGKSDNGKGNAGTPGNGGANKGSGGNAHGGGGNGGDGGRD